MSPLWTLQIDLRGVELAHLIVRAQANHVFLLFESAHFHNVPSLGPLGRTVIVDLLLDALPADVQSGQILVYPDDAAVPTGSLRSGRRLLVLLLGRGFLAGESGCRKHGSQQYDDHFVPAWLRPLDHGACQSRA